MCQICQFLLQFFGEKIFKNHGIGPWGRCYDHNFLRLSTIFGEKIGAFLKNQCYDQIYAYLSFVLSQKRHFLRQFFGETIFKNHDKGPWIFPVEVQPVELVLVQEVDDTADEGAPAFGGLGHVGEFLAAFVPPAHGQGDLQVAVDNLQVGGLAKPVVTILGRVARFFSVQH
jgi:hypothetical protein